jgi:preprotein translocase subunit SecE
MSIPTYLNETKAELRHVNWPTKSQAINYTIVVIVLSLVVAGLLGLFDLVFNLLLKLAL